MPEPTTHQSEPATPSASLQQLLRELGMLMETPAAPAQFYAEFLKRLLATLPVVGGAVWTRMASGSFDLEHAINWPQLCLDVAADGIACHTEILHVAAQRHRALWVPPHSGSKLVAEHGLAANRSDHGLLLAPVVVGKEVVGMLEMWLSPIPEAPQRRELARLLVELTVFLAAYHHKRDCQSTAEERHIQGELDTFVRRIHASLDPQTVAQWIAHEGRRLLGCDQVSVAIRGAKTRVAAVSDSAIVESSSQLIQCLRLLGDAVMHWGNTLVYQGQRDETLPPIVAQALDAYLAECNCKLLVAVPLKKHQSGREDTVAFATLTAEAFEPTFPAEKLHQRLRALAPHAESALGNAMEVAGMPLQSVSRALARARDWMNTRTVCWLGLYALPLVLLSAVLMLAPITLRLEAKGQLVPLERQMVYANQNGKVVEVRAHPGDRVDKGQELLFIEDLDTQLQIDQLAIKIGAAEQRLTLLSERLGSKTSNEERGVLVNERIQQQYELRKATVERDILLQSSRSPRKAPVFAPLSGKIVTFDAQEQLHGKTVKPGDPLVRIARVNGAWEIELQIPERNVGPIREGLLASKGGCIDVDLLLSSQPQRTYKGRLHKSDLGGEAKVVDNAVVLPARVQIEDEDLMKQLETLPVGLEVRCKVHCGPRSIGAVWFHELWEFLYEHFIF